MTKVPTPIIDKNGRATTVHKNLDDTTSLNRRVATIKPVHNETGLPQPLVPAPFGAIGIQIDAEGYQFSLTKDPSMNLYDGGISDIYEVRGSSLKDVRDQINEDLTDYYFRLNDTRGDKSKVQSIQNRIITLTALKGQVSEAEEIDRLKKWSKAADRIITKTDKMKLRNMWDLGDAHLHAIQRYGDFITAENPTDSGYERDVKLVEAMAENHPEIVHSTDPESITDYIHDIGVIYAAIREEMGKVGL